MRTRKPPFRLAQGLSDPAPREWTPREKYMLYARGFNDGAGVRAMRPECSGHPSYDRGYEDGQATRGVAVAAYAKEIGYQPSILRLAEEL